MSTLVTIYYRTNMLYFRSCSQTTTGLWLENDSTISLDTANGKRDTGNTVLNALGQSAHGIPHPTSWDADDNSLFWKLAGAKSWASFVKGASCVSVELDNGKMTVSPYINKGAKEGFTPILGKEIYLHGNLSADEIGAAVYRAFAFCEPTPTF